jgi:hypothetical protein
MVGMLRRLVECLGDWADHLVGFFSEPAEDESCGRRKRDWVFWWGLLFWASASVAWVGALVCLLSGLEDTWWMFIPALAGCVWVLLQVGAILYLVCAELWRWYRSRGAGAR